MSLEREGEEEERGGEERKAEMSVAHSAVVLSPGAFESVEWVTGLN